MHLLGRNLATGRGTRRGIAVGAALVLVAGVVVATTRDSPCPAFAMTTGDRVRINVVLADAHLHITGQLTHDGNSNEAAFSPTGRRVAYVSAGRLHVVALDGNDNHIATYGPVDYPTWSPDAQSLAFVRRARPNELWRVDLRSGRQKLLATAPDIQGRPQWLPDGRIVYLVPAGVMAAPAGGGNATLLVALSDRLAMFSPDGTKYAVQPPTGGLPINVVDIADGRVVKVPKSTSAITRLLAWTTGNQLVFTQNIRGALINIVTWRPGDKKPKLIYRSRGIPIDLADNPACAP
jgi:Tol biopolymer transport system component